MGEDPDGAMSAIEALERFVIENDDLTEIESLIGRFNVFDALNVARVEIRHSNFLAWLLDPNESHGQGALFLRAVLMDLLRSTPETLRPISPIELDGEELRGVQIRREWRNIDILVICKQPAFALVIENKIDGSEHSDQLRRYKDVLHQNFPDAKPLYVFLSQGRDDPSDADWVPYGYADIHRVLDRCRRVNAGSIGGDVQTFVDHYLRLIGSRFMNDPKIEELCQRIYRNHRQALELIFERVGSPTAGLNSEIHDLLASEPERWQIVTKRSKGVDFVPISWVGMLPPIGARGSFDLSTWLVLKTEIQPKALRLYTCVWPTTDAALRRRVIERLTADPKEFGFKHAHGRIKDEWTFFGEDIYRWQEDEEPDHKTVVEAVRQKLEDFRVKTQGVPDALRAIVAEYRPPVDRT